MSRFEVPEVGETVTLTTRYRSVLLGQQYQENRYENAEVIEPYPWLKPGQFCITGSGRMPVRVIDIARVIEFSGAGQETNSTDNRVIEVTGSKGSTYLVTIVDGNAVRCTCRGFQFRRDCRHLREAMKPAG